MIDLKNLTIKKAHESLKKGDFTVRELVSAYKKNIDEKNPDLNVYLEVFSDLDEQADSAQKKFSDGTADLLTGIPIAIKDNILIKGRVASGASKILENYKATYSATVIEKLQKSGAVFLGRTNMDEFAMGASTENSAYGVTKNPHDTSRVPGGSSGGSTVAVAADMTLVSLGSDTGGSIRQPASFCGVVGLKPTYGSVSRYGLMPMASSFNIIGPMAKNMEDIIIVFDAIRGVDPMDSITIEGENDSEVKTIGIPRDFLKTGIEEDILESFNNSVKKLEEAGYKIKDISIPQIEYALAVYYVLVPAEVSSDTARFDGVKFGPRISGDDLMDDYFKTRGQLFGQEVKRRIMLGTYVLSAGYADEYYNKAWQVRNVIKENFKKVFEEVDIIAMPVSPFPAFKIGEKANDPLQMYLADIFTVAANVTGIPAISIPSGTVDRDGKGLPVGLQLLAPHLHEKKLFEVGKKFETME